MAQLYLDSLDDKITPRAVRKALTQIQEQSQESGDEKSLNVLTRVYAQTMERIRGQKDGFRTHAEQVLSWITRAKRTLTTSELRHALAVEPGNRELDEENIPSIQNLVSVCCELVTVDKKVISSA